jgi:hypothetical protein
MVIGRKDEVGQVSASVLPPDNRRRQSTKGENKGEFG